MTKREKMLAAAVVLLILGWGLTRLWSGYQDALERRNSELLAARDELGQAQLAEARGRDAMRLMSTWQDQSLPANEQESRSLYLSWLMDQLREAGLEGSIDLDPNTPRSEAYRSLGYTIQAKGSLAALTRFLYGFYHSDQLHKMTLLRLRPEGDTDTLSATIKVEALMVSGATLEDSLSEGTSERLALDSADTYETSISGRQIFEAYRPARPRPEIRQPQSDPAAQTFVTYIQSGDPPQVWFTNRTTGRVLRLKEGEPIRIRGFNGSVSEIRLRDVVVQSGDERLVVKVGKNLREAVQLEAEGENRS